MSNLHIRKIAKLSYIWTFRHRERVGVMERTSEYLEWASSTRRRKNTIEKCPYKILWHCIMSFYGHYRVKLLEKYVQVFSLCYHSKFLFGKGEYEMRGMLVCEKVIFCRRTHTNTHTHANSSKICGCPAFLYKACF